MDYGRAVARLALATIVRQSLADASSGEASSALVEQSSLEALLDVLTRFLRTVGAVSASTARHAGRGECNFDDVRHGIAALSAASPEALLAFLRAAPEEALTQAVAHFPTCPPPAARAARWEEPRPLHVAEWLPPFPHASAYKRTPSVHTRESDAPTAKKKRSRRKREAQALLYDLQQLDAGGAAGGARALPPPALADKRKAAGEGEEEEEGEEEQGEAAGRRVAVPLAPPDALLPRHAPVLQSSAARDCSGLCDEPPQPPARGAERRGEEASAGASSDAPDSQRRQKMEAILRLQHEHGLEAVRCVLACHCWAEDGSSLPRALRRAPSDQRRAASSLLPARSNVYGYLRSGAGAMASFHSAERWRVALGPAAQAALFEAPKERPPSLALSPRVGWCLGVVALRAAMAAVPTHAAVATLAEYSLAFTTTGTPATVNASDMGVEVESSHWFVSVASHELVASGLRYVVTYAQLNELMWCVAECDVDLRSVKFVQTPARDTCGATGSPEALHQVMRDLGAVQATGTKKDTAEKEDWAFGWWQRARASAGTTWLRNDPAGFSVDAEARAVWAARETLLTKTLALLVARKRVLPRAVSVRMLTLPFGTKVGGHAVDWESTFWLMIDAMFVTMLNTGLRKCSVSTAHPDDFQILLCNVSWWLGGEHVSEPTRQDLQRVRPGNLADKQGKRAF
ncbi:hypothetical protein AB1Y20_016478 [Prymnesium parvum]|uniref:Transcription initiation factor TFIID subunit 8 n=1 Tax=Prymnesium parvum TaxID=97485 RepID=A0AB34ICU6_PRYPA